MKESILFILIALFFCTLVEAQAYTDRIEAHHQQFAVAAIRLPYAKGLIKKAVTAYMAGRGYRSGHLYGYLIFRDVAMRVGEAKKRDLYFFVGTPIRADRELSTLSLIPSEPNTDGPPATGNDSTVLDMARIFLDSLSPFVVQYATGERVREYEQRLRKSQRKLDGLVSRQAHLEKRMRALDARLTQNRIAQGRAVADLQNNINLEAEKKAKYQYKIDRLLNQRDDLEKSIRLAQEELRDILAEQKIRQAEILSLRQTLSALQTETR